MRRSSLLAVVLLPWLLACSPPPALPSAPPSVSRSAQPPANDAVADARVAALEVVEALKRRDMATVARYAHPTMGVLFAPYAYLEPSEHQIWTATTLPRWFTDTQTRIWGAEDGTGFPIERTPAQYYERFVFPRDFTVGAKISVNDDQAKGNSINNAASLYPDGVRVEFYLPPTETPEGPLPDWRALRLVFVPVGGEPKLVAVVHDQWTI
jgi:hypothetical protein